jgi:hypothetical protein
MLLSCPNPTCKKKLPAPVKTCPSCRADLSLLVHYVENLQEGLDQAERLTRAGELGEAMWAYLAVLEVDPDNATARRQVGKVATAVRQFDDTAPGRRWLKRIHKQHWYRRWLAGLYSGDNESSGWLSTVVWAALLVVVFVTGYVVGLTQNRPAPPNPAPAANADKP